MPTAAESCRFLHNTTRLTSMDSNLLAEKFREPLRGIRSDFNTFWYTGTPFRFLEFVDYVHSPYKSKSLNINDEGFRGHPIPKGRVKGRKKIAFFGSSALMGIPNCSDAETIAAQLETILGTKGVPSDVVNFGLISGTMKHDLNLALRKLNEYEFDAVLLLNGYNDLYCAEQGNIWRHYDVVDKSLHEAFQWRQLALDKGNLVKHALRIFFGERKDSWRKIKNVIDLENAARLNRARGIKTTTPCFEFLETIFPTYLELFKNLCRIKNLPFIYSFQPSAYATAKSLSPYEMAALDTGTEFGGPSDYRAVRRARFSAAYGKLRERAYRLFPEGDAECIAVDLDERIKMYGENESAFYDYCHLLAPACKEAAEALAQELVPILKSK